MKVFVCHMYVGEKEEEKGMVLFFVFRFFGFLFLFLVF